MIKLDEKFIEQVKAKYVGKWIAIKGGKVLATSVFHEDIYKRLTLKEIDGAYILYSPTEEQKKCGFLFRVSVWK